MDSWTKAIKNLSERPQRSVRSVKKPCHSWIVSSGKIQEHQGIESLYVKEVIWMCAQGNRKDWSLGLRDGK